MIDPVSVVSVPAIESETLILIPHTVKDLSDLVGHPEEYLVSIAEDPVRAAAQWHTRLERNPYGSDGLVRLSHYGRDVFTADQWDDVDGIWRELVCLCRDFLEYGSAEAFFPGQPLRMALERNGKVAIMTVGADRFPVQPREFVTGVLDEAAGFFRWVEEQVGLARDDAFGNITGARRLLSRS